MLVLEIMCDNRSRDRVRYYFYSLILTLTLFGSVPTKSDENLEDFFIAQEQLEYQNPQASQKTLKTTSFLSKKTILRRRQDLENAMDIQLQSSPLKPRTTYMVQVISPAPKTYPAPIFYVNAAVFEKKTRRCDTPALLNLVQNALNEIKGTTTSKVTDCAPETTVVQSPSNLSSNPSTNTPIPRIDSSWTFKSMQNYVINADFDFSSLQIVPRKIWGAAPTDTSSMIPMGQINGIVIHHTANLWPTQDPRSIQKDHKQRTYTDKRGNEKHWPDVGYHFIIAKNKFGTWQVYEGRELKYQGAHAGISKEKQDKNIGQIGIVIAGNYEEFSLSNPAGYSLSSDEYQKQPEPEAAHLLGMLINKLKTENSSIISIKTHGQGHDAINPDHTLCPGAGCLPLVKAMKDKFNL